MSAILVTGGTGTLGSALMIPRARKAGHRIRTLSRRSRPDVLPAGDEWIQADLATAPGLDEATDGVDVVVRAATAGGFGDYDRAKYRIEADVLESRVPATVVRATRFHAFVLRFVRVLGRSPVMLVPAGFHIRSVSAGEFAADLAGRIADGPGGRAPDFAGPEVMELADMARTWAGVRNKRRRVVGLPLPGKTTV